MMQNTYRPKQKLQSSLRFLDQRTKEPKIKVMCYRALPYPSLSPVLLPHISLTFKRLSSDGVRPRSMTPGPGEAGPAPAPRLVTGTLSTPGPSQCHSQLEARRQVQSEQSRGAHSTGCQEGGSVTVMMRPRQPRHSRHRGERQER